MCSNATRLIGGETTIPTFFDTREVRITIGAENALPGIEDCTLITSRYAVDGKTHGSLGILGPTRMEYARAISLVDYVARMFGRVLETGTKS